MGTPRLPLGQYGLFQYTPECQLWQQVARHVIDSFELKN